MSLIEFVTLKSFPQKKDNSSVLMSTVNTRYRVSNEID
ncbi:hypothetical protein S7335_2987 [Synechococcus sp. PCC 7335]|nr:hypothetical protein S7335_2987 [Synechococcus sp. PCC 7335]